MSQIIFKISVLFTFCLLIIVVKKAEIVLTLINDTGKVLNGDFGGAYNMGHNESTERKRNQETTEVSEELSF